MSSSPFVDCLHVCCTYLDMLFVRCEHAYFGISVPLVMPLLFVFYRQGDLVIRRLWTSCPANLFCVGHLSLLYSPIRQCIIVVLVLDYGISSLGWFLMNQFMICFVFYNVAFASRVAHTYLGL